MVPVYCICFLYTESGQVLVSHPEHHSVSTWWPRPQKHPTALPHSSDVWFDKPHNARGQWEEGEINIMKSNVTIQTVLFAPREVLVFGFGFSDRRKATGSNNLSWNAEEDGNRKVGRQTDTLFTRRSVPEATLKDGEMNTLDRTHYVFKPSRNWHWSLDEIAGSPLPNGPRATIASVQRGKNTRAAPNPPVPGLRYGFKSVPYDTAVNKRTSTHQNKNTKTLLLKSIIYQNLLLKKIQIFKKELPLHFWQNMPLKYQLYKFTHQPYTIIVSY